MVFRVQTGDLAAASAAARSAVESGHVASLRERESGRADQAQQLQLAGMMQADAQQQRAIAAGYGQQILGGAIQRAEGDRGRAHATGTLERSIAAGKEAAELSRDFERDEASKARHAAAMEGERSREFSREMDERASARFNAQLFHNLEAQERGFMNSRELQAEADAKAMERTVYSAARALEAAGIQNQHQLALAAKGFKFDVANTLLSSLMETGSLRAMQGPKLILQSELKHVEMIDSAISVGNHKFYEGEARQYFEDYARAGQPIVPMDQLESMDGAEVVRLYADLLRRNAAQLAATVDRQVGGDQASLGQVTSFLKGLFQDDPEFAGLLDAVKQENVGGGAMNPSQPTSMPQMPNLPPPPPGMQGGEAGGLGSGFRRWDDGRR